MEQDRADGEKSVASASAGGPSEPVSIKADRSDLRFVNGLKIKSEKKIKILKTKVVH